jgi:hypothetical protein
MRKDDMHDLPGPESAAEDAGQPEGKGGNAKESVSGPQLAPGQSLSEFCDAYQEFA